MSEQFLVRFASFPETVEKVLHSPSLSLLLKILLIPGLPASQFKLPAGLSSAPTLQGWRRQSPISWRRALRVGTWWDCFHAPGELSPSHARRWETKEEQGPCLVPKVKRIMCFFQLRTCLHSPGDLMLAITPLLRQNPTDAVDVVSEHSHFTKEIYCIPYHCTFLTSKKMYYDN